MCLARTLAHSLSEMTTFWGIAAVPPSKDAPPIASAPRTTARRSRPFGSSLGSDIYVSPEQNFWPTKPDSSITGCQPNVELYLANFQMVIGDHLRGSDFTTHVGDQRILKCPLQHGNLVGVQLDITNLSYSFR
jgi:hypothetical protein